MNSPLKPIFVTVLFAVAGLPFRLAAEAGEEKVPYVAPQQFYVEAGVWGPVAARSGRHEANSDLALKRSLL